MADEQARLRCACGWEITGTQEEVVVVATEHGAKVHNMRPTREEVLAMIVREPRGRVTR